MYRETTKSLSPPPPTPLQNVKPKCLLATEWLWHLPGLWIVFLDLYAGIVSIARAFKDTALLLPSFPLAPWL